MLKFIKEEKLNLRQRTFQNFRISEFSRTLRIKTRKNIKSELELKQN